MENGVSKAIEKAGSGLAGAKAIAALLGVSYEFIYRCKRKGWFPTERARVVSDTYGVPLEELVRHDVRAAIEASKS